MKGRSVVQPGENTKWCSGCKNEKPLDEFHKNRSRPDGLQNRCKACSGQSVKNSVAKAKKAELVAKHHSKLNLYGMTPQDYERMVFDQDNKCAICSVEMDPPYIDFSLTSGELRALLCNHCKSALGLFREDLELLNKALSYLSSFKTEEPLAVTSDSLGYVASI